jgi:hypothetical protein
MTADARKKLTKAQVSLADCPIGLFLKDGELCVKSEYGDNEGRIDAYIVSSGEFFWGGAKTRAQQRKVLVIPVDHRDLMNALELAIGHIDHMAAFIASQNAGYSFESLGEDSDNIRLPLAAFKGEQV